ncbi:MAG: ROK family protein [Calditrichaeota bacterium]|nr:MAG: ROK family protein [Calditrichota bacterium]
METTRSVYIGLDIGGTKTLVAAATETGRILTLRRADTPLKLAQGLQLIKDLTREVAQGATIRGMGAAVGGPLEYRTGVVSPLHQPEWREVPLKQIMETEFQAPFTVDVDTNLAALGEYTFGGERSSRLLYITLSTGMGGGLLLEGEIYRGVDGAHPEVGHQAIPFRCAYPERVQCECGAPDCLEGLISGNAIRRIYGKPPEALTDAEWAEVGYNLGQGLRNAAALYAPEVIVLGGGVALGGGEKLLTPAREVLRRHLNIVPVPEVRLSHLQDQAPLMGAIAVAIRNQ